MTVIKIKINYLGSEETIDTATHLDTQNEKTPVNTGVFVCLSGLYWIRTSDLCPVKAAL
jgi:hypothetical protein